MELFWGVGGEGGGPSGDDGRKFSVTATSLREAQSETHYPSPERFNEIPEGRWGGVHAVISAQRDRRGKVIVRGVS